ncbi:hypothetical protein GDO81_021512 [Engystomops pustulosus]|uniref:THAP-type domain-containing protein n=1 Tax=Engystomops pustulosus TaxID=76066 RepID=A0AAV6ZIV6_ENGPU|nr:hypothetical protein GDO81_021512 [Engystomops pustulosus]
MPTCLINQCCSKTGKKGQSSDIILHPFPTDLTRIYRWLFHTGQQFTNVDELANRIKTENKNKKYRLCSKHFARDSYIRNATSRVLRREAVPTIFPRVKEGEVLIEESLKKSYKRKRIVEEVEFVEVPRPLNMPEFEDESHISYSEMSTQTDFTLLNSFVLFLNSTSQVVDNPALGVQYSHTGPSAPPPLLSSPNPKEMDLLQGKRPNLSNIKIEETTSDPRDFLTGIEPRPSKAESAPDIVYRNIPTHQLSKGIEGTRSHPRDFLMGIEPHSLRAEPPPDISRSLKVEPAPDIGYGHFTTHRVPKEIEETIVKIEETTSYPRDFLMDIEPRSTSAEPPPDSDYGTITTHQLPKDIENKLSILDKREIKEEIGGTGEKTFGKSEVLASFLEETKQQPSQLDLRPTEEQREQNRKLIIFESSLDQLLRKVKCSDSTGCSSLVESFEKNFEGGYCKIRGKCSAGHSFTMDLLLETFH